MILEVVLQGVLQPVALGYVVAAVAVVGAVSVLAMVYVNRYWAALVGLVFELVLVALFAYTVNIVYALYSAPGFGSYQDIVLGTNYQRVAAGTLSAMLFIGAVLAIGYYLELQRGRGHE